MTNSQDVAEWVVLVADDEPDNLDVIVESLRFFGAKQVLATKSGVEILKSLETFEPTFVLLDIAMPEMDGWEVFKRIRANDKTKHLTVIALSAHAMKADIDRAMAVGFDGYLTKPISIPTLIQDIKVILGSTSRKGEKA